VGEGTIDIDRGPEPRRWTDADERVISTEAVRGIHQRRTARRRFLIRRHTSRWCELFPNVPAWIVWDRTTGKITPHATWRGALRYVEAYWATTSTRYIHPDDPRPHHCVPGYGWAPIEEPSA
jgi:hypothetical protein